MHLSRTLAQKVREAFEGGNWTSVSFKEKLADVTWREATTRIGDHHSIAALVYHVDYYFAGVIPVLRGGKLEIRDKFSFDHPIISDEDDWQKLLRDTYLHATTFADLVAAYPPEKLSEVFTEEKYGDYHRNFHGILEHCYYHLGQISLLKKLIRAQASG
ncbi:DUF1572 domain-containing protein [Lewinella sp. IMCC34183]|uniref:DUF1572 domain-containing protein n=1 Tax=Lewinella sp. IMCC34183 TaxID=2248762 RepID=UPI000E25CFFD|nr:DUF1572 domain-containing protein [Lewinella sp. IMCC34183]